ncbi:bifunctional diguanylate cyclase/phosphodiesterase [Alteromonas sp. 009811495]|uniref:bifunctional diguanylate cyclase/phosphodiesterase n=1 Tax=Alteromonas sp. 009811495 TaxID=3002962 RepID=UPI00237D9536|nr:GGDEF domain-containing phosphodiesterase [Alteromonas sp. 009811495]WDT86527.1 GGDEF domain-containing phosphodiesterase [Alteromonas sp. 009811495]
MLTRLKSALQRYLLLDSEHLNTTDASIWRLSVLRIILLVGAILTSAIVVHSSYTAYMKGMYHVLVLTIGFSLLLYATLAIKRPQVKLASYCLVSTVVAASFCIVFFTVDFTIARYGFLLLFTLPIIVRLMYGTKASVLVMLFNIVPYILLINNQSLSPLAGIDITLPETHTYIASVLFLFFNFCIPLAVLRVMSSLEKQSSSNLQQSRKLNKLVHQYQEIFNNGGTPSFFCDEQGRILQANKAGRKLIRKFKKAQHTHADNIEDIFELSSPFGKGENQSATIKGDSDCEFILQFASLTHHQKQLIHCHDVSSMRKSTRELDAIRKQQFEKLYTNELTLLKNHNYWRKSDTEETIINKHVVLLKLSNLRDINLRYGHSVGDDVLRDVASQLKKALSSSVELYHFPGAKFLFALPNLQLAGQNIETWLGRQLPRYSVISLGNEDRNFQLEWRAGYAIPTKEISPDTAVECCTIALSQCTYQIPFAPFSANAVRVIRENTQHKDKVKSLLDNGCLALFLQPQVDTEEHVVSYEVLARLNDRASNTILQPAQFIPVVEENGWDILFTQKVIDGTVELITSWPKNLPFAPLAINLSGPELLSDVFYEKLLRRFSENPVLCKQIKLELTETSVLASHNETKRRLKSLANIGATIIIDDFGTGHASLSQLIDMSASVLKIDREFIESIETSERHRKIVEMTVNLAKSLNMKTVAEGVETIAQFEALQVMGVTMFQGYLFGKPAPVSHWVAQESIHTHHAIK